MRTCSDASQRLRALTRAAPNRTRHHLLVLTITAVHVCMCCVQADFVMFSILSKLDPPGMDDAFLIGTRATAILVKRTHELIATHVNHARRKDSFASELLSVYKSAIGMQLFIDAPPCRTCPASRASLAAFASSAAAATAPSRRAIVPCPQSPSRRWPSTWR